MLQRSVLENCCYENQGSSSSKDWRTHSLELPLTQSRLFLFSKEEKKREEEEENTS